MRIKLIHEIKTDFNRKKFEINHKERNKNV